MSNWIKATLLFLFIIGGVALVAGVSFYAATHPWFAIHVLLPIIGILFFGCVWIVCYLIVKD